MKRRTYFWLTAGMVACIIAAVLFFRSLWSNPFDWAAAKLDRYVSAERIEKQLSILAAKPHRAGTPENQKVGDAILDRLRRLGLKVWTHERKVHLYEPLETRLFLTFPEKRELDLREKVLQEDVYSQAARQEIPYFAFSPNADLEAEVIYANFGAKEDYDFLKKQGIVVTRKIALVRAQGICRSMKTLVAEEEGVAGLLLFPELRDQGILKPSYPKGPNVNPWVVQRGSLLKYFLQPGDPYAPEANSAVLPKIPAIPVSQQTAMELLGKIQGTPAPDLWKGWLPVSYPIGSGPVRVRMVTRGETRERTIRNIFAALPTSTSVEQSILLGSHYDAWVYGASDPGSGSAILLEAADALVHLVGKGWKPRRNITFVFWDAEEYGMFGSTAWVEENLSQIRDHTAVFLYVDSMRGPFFSAYVTPGLRASLDETLAKIKDPQTGQPALRVRGEYDVPGFSSDTIPFTNIAGIPIADLHYGTSYPMYHSVYDDVNWMSKYCDPGYRYCANFAKILALYTVRLTSSDLFPYRFSEMAAFLTHVLAQLRNQLPVSSPSDASLELLAGRIGEFEKIAKRIDRLAEEQSQLSEENRARVNSLLTRAILVFTPAAEQVQRMPDISERNTLVGPSDENQCNGFPLPRLQRAMRSQDPAEVATEIRRLSDAFSQSAQILTQAEALLHPPN